MSRTGWQVLVRTFVVLLAASEGAVGACAPGKDLVGEAKRLLSLEAKGDFAGVESSVAPDSQRTLSKDTLRGRWVGIARRAGRLKSIGASRQQKLAQYDLVNLTCKFDKGDVDARIAFNAEGKVVAFYFTPSPGSKLPPEPRAPSGGRGGPPQR